MTVFAGVPTMSAAMLHHPEAATRDVSALDACVSGGKREIEVPELHG